MEIKIKKKYLLITTALSFAVLSVVLLGRSKFLALAGDTNENTSLLAKKGAVQGVKAADPYALIDPTLADSISVDPPPPSASISSSEVTISHTVKTGDSLATIAAKYHADSQTIIDYPYNNFGEDLTLKVGQVLIIPNGYINNPPPSPVIAFGTGQFAWPVSGGNVTQYTSWWHPGAVDIAVSAGTPIRAADNAKVAKVEKLTTGYGWHVILDHKNGLTSLYGHMSQINVEVGQSISKGDILGSSGSTGRSTGPHLHFEVRKANNPVDPMTLLPTQ